MDSIETIIQQINEQAEKEREQFEKNERAQQIQAFDSEKARIKEEESKRKEKQLQQVNLTYKQKKNRQQIDNRQKLLTEKQVFLNKLFNEAVQAMEDWSKEEHRAFAKAALRTLPLSGEQLFLVGQKSTSYFTEDWLTKINSELPFTLKLSTEEVPQQAGFLVDNNGVQYNFLYKSLIQDIEETMRFEMATYLFG
ncbi:V/A-type H+/Na+-transporting ATPase subunit E [Enterococcus sp. AZ194]|uniref:ATPase V n=1 Tax=Enterococcus sp. AZ194 TaxID=2774629 RepID=UPI003F225FFE